MQLSTRELAQARETIQELMEDLDIETYGFDVEPAGDEWNIALEYPTHSGWQALSLRIERQRLERVHDDLQARAALLAEWRSRLS